MNPVNLENLDQDQIESIREKLRLYTANARAMLSNSTGETVAAPALTGDLFDDVRALTAHATDLENRLGIKAPQFVAGVTTSRHSQSRHESMRVGAPNCSNGVTAEILKTIGADSLEAVEAKRNDPGQHYSKHANITKACLAAKKQKKQPITK